MRNSLWEKELQLQGMAHQAHLISHQPSQLLQGSLPPPHPSSDLQSAADSAQSYCLLGGTARGLGLLALEETSVYGAQHISYASGLPSPSSPYQLCARQVSSYCTISPAHIRVYVFICICMEGGGERENCPFIITLAHLVSSKGEMVAHLYMVGFSLYILKVF